MLQLLLVSVFFTVRRGPGMACMASRRGGTGASSVASCAQGRAAERETGGPPLWDCADPRREVIGLMCVCLRVCVD